MVSVTTRQPSPRSGVSAAAGPRLLVRQVQYLLSSQLTLISEGSSPIRLLGTRLVACSSASAWDCSGLTVGSANEIAQYKYLCYSYMQLQLTSCIIRSATVNAP